MLNLPWTAVENSWRYTTIYDSNDQQVCRFDLEDVAVVTEDNQEACEDIQRARVNLILASVNATAAMKEKHVHD